jgi:hypothetical protein
MNIKRNKRKLRENKKKKNNEQTHTNRPFKFEAKKKEKRT